MVWTWSLVIFVLWLISNSSSVCSHSFQVFVASNMLLQTLIRLCGPCSLVCSWANMSLDSTELLELRSERKRIHWAVCKPIGSLEMMEHWTRVLYRSQSSPHWGQSRQYFCSETLSNYWHIRDKKTALLHLSNDPSNRLNPGPTVVPCMVSPRAILIVR